MEEKNLATSLVKLFVSKITSDKKYLVIDNDSYEVWFDERMGRYIHAKNNTFNMIFFKNNGYTVKWGKTLEDDPAYNPFGNEIADIEITKACRGIRDNEGKRTPCKFCYKSNCPTGTYMNLETFKKLFDVLDKQKTMTQIAFGVDAEASEELNPDIWKIFEYAKEHNVTPNVTVADITKETAKKIVSLCGACAVSAYQSNKNCCYDSVKLLTEEAKKQEKKTFACNIHLMISKETLPFVYEVLDDYQKDERLKDLNAIVFLSLKQKGRGESFHKISEMEFKKIIDFCFEKKIRFGMDSCSANKFLNAIKDRPDYELMASFVESCESCNFSSFFDVNGTFYPCSFMEKEGEWKHGIELKNVKNINDIWYDPRVVTWRNLSLERIRCNGCNKCPYYDV